MDHSTYEPSPGWREFEHRGRRRGRGGEGKKGRGRYEPSPGRRESQQKRLTATRWEAIGGRGRGGEVVGSYWMGGSRREGEGNFALTHTSAWQSSSAVNLHNATTEGTRDTPPEGGGWQRVAS